MKEPDIETIPLDSLDTKLRRKISSLTAEYLRLGKEIDSKIADLVESRNVIKETIQDLVLSIPQDSKFRMQSDRWRINKTRNVSTEISAAKLLSRGVELEDIEFATEEKKGKWYVRIEEIEEKKK